MVLACLITGYNPKSVTVTWHLGTQIQNQIMFPETDTQGSYTTSSQLVTPPLSQRHQGEYKCTVKHTPSNTNKEKTFHWPGR